MITSEFARRLDKLLQNEFKILNPFNDLRIRTVILRQTEGDVSISQADSGNIFEARKPKHPISPTITVDPDTGSNGFVRDDGGHQLGKEMETNARGLFESRRPYPNDQREGWLDIGHGTVIYNESHPVAKPFPKLSLVNYYNMARVVVSTLNKEANEQQKMDAKEGLVLQEKLLGTKLLTEAESMC